MRATSRLPGWVRMTVADVMVKAPVPGVTRTGKGIRALVIADEGVDGCGGAAGDAVDSNAPDRMIQTTA